MSLSEREKCVIPPSLRKGDRIRIISPSGNIDAGIIDRAEEMLAGAGYSVVTGKYARSSYGRFAGTAEQRLSDIQEAFDDEQTRVVLCSRGGYGAVQIIDSVDMTAFRRSPKWVVGYSDISAIHAMLQTEGVASVHALMLKYVTEHGLEDRYVERLMTILQGGSPVYDVAPHPFNRCGVTEGVLRGGNLAVVNGLRGTRFDYIPDGTILFVEDIGERPYQIDRMLWNLRIGGVLARISGLIVGQFTGYEDDMSMGCSVYQLIRDMVAPYGYPVCFDFPVGHVDANEPLVCGAPVRMSVESDSVHLEYVR